MFRFQYKNIREWYFICWLISIEMWALHSQIIRYFWQNMSVHGYFYVLPQSRTSELRLKYSEACHIPVLWQFHMLDSRWHIFSEVWCLQRSSGRKAHLREESIESLPVDGICQERQRGTENELVDIADLSGMKRAVLPLWDTAWR